MKKKIRWKSGEDFVYKNIAAYKLHENAGADGEVYSCAGCGDADGLRQR